MEKLLQRLYRDYIKLGGKLEFDEWKDWYISTFYTINKRSK